MTKRRGCGKISELSVRRTQKKRLKAKKIKRVGLKDVKAQIFFEKRLDKAVTDVVC